MPLMVTKQPGGVNPPLKIPAMLISELSVTVKGVVTVVLPAQKSTATPDENTTGVDCAELALHSALVFQVAARFAAVAVAVPSGSQ